MSRSCRKSYNLTLGEIQVPLTAGCSGALELASILKQCRHGPDQTMDMGVTLVLLANVMSISPMQLRWALPKPMRVWEASRLARP